MLTFLIALTVIFFFLTLYAIAQENVLLLDNSLSAFLSLKILDTSSSASLFVTLLGVLLVRHQFVLGFRPRINYESERVIGRGAHGEINGITVWQVKLRNTGLGAAVINQYSFKIGIQKVAKDLPLSSFDNIVKEFEAIGLIPEKDYRLFNLTNGFTVQPKEDRIVFEINIEHIHKIKQLDLVLRFEGLLGDRYIKEIFCIPRSKTVLPALEMMDRINT